MMTPIEIVQAQLDAYNARDIDRFMEFWADDCQYYAFPDQLLADGVAAIRERHLVRFQEPALFGRLIARIDAGDLIIDQEVVTRNFADGVGEVDVVAIYDVGDGKIKRAWFKQGTPRPKD